MAISVVVSNATYNNSTATRTPTVTFSGYTPVLNDVVVMFGGCPSITTTFNGLPAGWTRLGASGTTYWTSSSNSRISFGIYHVIDATDVSGGTTTYSATNYASATGFMLGLGAVLRGVDLTDVLDDWDSDAVTTAATTHIIAGAAMTNINHSNGIWLAGMIKTNTTAYPSPPAGWTTLASGTSGTTNIGAYALMRRTALVSPADMPISDVNITGMAGVYATTSTVISAAAAAANTGGFFAMF